jgi:lipoprotein-anchoring transpeptidase ErfK/SrfK
VLGASVSVTGIAMLGGVGVLPSVASDRGDGARAGESLTGVSSPPSGGPSSTPSTDSAAVSSKQQLGAQPSATHGTYTAAQDPPVPADSGEGKRIVFDQSEQRVWLVGDDGQVERTYLVSGSLYDNLFPGRYSVYSKSVQAWGVDDSGTMKYFVRFTHGTNGAAIGFHDIPVDDGQLVQTAAQLGTPQSHGCIRQLRDDAIALWDFAPVGTEVDVTA